MVHRMYKQGEVKIRARVKKQSSKTEQGWAKIFVGLLLFY